MCSRPGATKPLVPWRGGRCLAGTICRRSARARSSRSSGGSSADRVTERDVQRAAAISAIAGLCLAASLIARADGDAVAAVTVTPFGPVAPGNAPGEALYLVRYTIPPGIELPLHHHEGTQIGLVVAGELTYRVVSGEVPVFRTEPG